jgi:hypothetical protein
MRGFELVEKLPRGPSLSSFRTFRALPDTFLGVGVSSNIEQSLIGFSVLHDGCCFPLHCQYHGTLAFFELLHEIAGTTPESRRDWISLVMSKRKRFHGELRVRSLVGAVGIEPSSPVQTRKLFIPRSDKNYKTTETPK